MVFHPSSFPPPPIIPRPPAKSPPPAKFPCPNSSICDNSSAMNLFTDTQMLFAQLAAIPDAQAVKTLIENHDALQHSDGTLAALDRSLRTRLATLPRDLVRDERIQ